MKDISRTILETILRISGASSKDETRPNLCGVNIFKKDNVVTIQAVDGHIMARETIITDEFFDDEITLCSRDIKKLKKLLKDYKSPLFNCSLNDKAMLIEIASEVVSITLIKREFPRVDSILPAKKDGEIAIAINPEYLLTLFESLKLVKNQSSITLRFDPCNPLSPIKAFIEGNESQTAVIMPCISDEVKMLSQEFQRLIELKKGA